MKTDNFIEIKEEIGHRVAECESVLIHREIWEKGNLSWKVILKLFESVFIHFIVIVCTYTSYGH